jgi:hypothetical protein
MASSNLPRYIAISGEKYNFFIVVSMLYYWIIFIG